MSCNICGSPDYLRCECESAQPFCDQCADDNNCVTKMDAQCVIYHLDNTTPSQLTNLGISNGASVEEILEAIDDLIGSNFNIPFEPVDSRSIAWTPGGIAGHKPEADVILSTDAGQIIVERVNGLFAENDHLVKVDDECDPDFLVNVIEGGVNVSGGFSIDVVKEDCKLILVPVFNIENFISTLCAESSFEDCLEGHETPFTAVDTASVSWTPGGINGHSPEADVNISGDIGNIILIHADGLYASGGAIDALNGTHLDGTTVKLGGDLIENTEIDFGALYQLSFIGSPKISIGDNAAIPEYLRVISDDDSLTILSTIYLKNDLSNNNIGSINVVLEITGGAFAQSNINHTLISNAGQLWIHPTANSSISTDTEAVYTGLYGTAIKSGAGDLTGNILSGGYFTGFAADAGDVGEMAGVRIGGVYEAPPILGGTFTGTIGNYYGIYIEDIAASDYGPSITNKFAIYQEGTTDISRFFGLVQNAGGGAEFTSDSRVKENISEYEYGLDQIEQLNTYEFNYTYKKDKKVVGVIAQEVEKILPGAVTQGEFGVPNTDESYTDFRFIDQNRLFYAMLNAIKELSVKVKSLESKS